MTRLLSLLSVLFMLSVAGCGSGKPMTGAPTRKLEVSGSATLSPAVAEIAKRFESKNPGVRVNVQTGGSSKGIADCQKGLVEIGMSSRDLKDDEKKELKSVAIARDGLCIIVHKDNPIASLTDEQIVGIYTGKITNWKDVGGADRPITVVSKAEGRATLEAFTHYYKLKNPDIKASVIIGDNAQGIKTVAGSPDAIGYVSVGNAEFAAKDGTPIKSLPLKGVAATIENVRNGTFLLSRQMFLVTRGEASGLGKEFIDFCRSKEVHDLMKEQFLVPIE